MGERILAKLSKGWADMIKSEQLSGDLTLDVTSSRARTSWRNVKRGEAIRGFDLTPKPGTKRAVR